MGIFSKPEIIIFKESNSAEEHLAKLEELLPRATGKVKENIQKEIILTKAGIDGEKKVLYELKIVIWIWLYCMISVSGQKMAGKHRLIS